MTRASRCGPVARLPRCRTSRWVPRARYFQLLTPARLLSITLPHSGAWPRAKPGGHLLAPSWAPLAFLKRLPGFQGRAPSRFPLRLHTQTRSPSFYTLEPIEPASYGPPFSLAAGFPSP